MAEKETADIISYLRPITSAINLNINININIIGGVDEVGRGPLIGPVVSACCVLPHDFELEGLNDSKKLSEKKREKFYDYIIENCVAYGVGIISPEKIDEVKKDPARCGIFTSLSCI